MTNSTFENYDKKTSTALTAVSPHEVHDSFGMERGSTDYPINHRYNSPSNKRYGQMKAYNNQSVLNHLKDTGSPMLVGSKKNALDTFATEKRSKTKGIFIEKKQSQKTMVKN